MAIQYNINVEVQHRDSQEEKRLINLIVESARQLQELNSTTSVGVTAKGVKKNG